jgi:cation diffusion facilitator family transporter
VNIIRQNKAIFTALIANCCIAVMKLVVAIFSGSASLFSEAIHSCADTLNQIVLLVGKKQASREPNFKHPFGYSRVSFFASFCVAMLLFFIGGAYSLMEAIEKISHISGGGGEHDQNSFIVAIVVLLVSIVLEGFSLRTAIHEVREEQEKTGADKSLLRFFRETRNSPLIVVMTEDLAALLGLLFALLGVLLTLITGNPLFDAIGGAVVGCLLIVAAFVLGKETASLIIGESLPKQKVREIEELISATPEVAGCKIVKTVAIGADSVLVEADISFVDEDNISAARMMDVIATIKAGICDLLASEASQINTCIEPVRIGSAADITG